MDATDMKTVLLVLFGGVCGLLGQLGYLLWLEYEWKIKEKFESWKRSRKKC